MLVSLDAGLEDAFGIVDAAGVSLETKEHLTSGSRAIHTIHIAVSH